MKIYSSHGFNDFVLCLGYHSAKIEQHFTGCDQWHIAFAETGEDTNTGGRIKRIEKYIDGEDFFATYADGLANLDLNDLLRFHRSHERIASVTVVNPRTHFGILKLNDDDLVTEFEEKPLLNQWINGGFFVFNRKVFRYLTDDSILEREPLEQLATERQLVAYKHTGFWRCMDTFKDNLELNQLWEAGQADWKIWSD
ncbi:glucose-1-phosphate cytidylyltransferase [Candidatus Hakubella thermalkaliphila]|uniref:Glucose-1-phosphate cytidylyltransferase n=2 Tax=Candidatus Hakubella thermalkaliphila TaxID=2754717 RepID=A0A6V8P669_9ACTN|nr:glucose-1-phosphate cytidylyltransferase [Candidatus Hakubella thermalkaliphila]GFP42709.1 glucose-1-phosphate cytidylyltransferase [Candidatus Hakubella thermalkaliphila]